MPLLLDGLTPDELQKIKDRLTGNSDNKEPLPTPAEFRPGVSPIPADATLQGDSQPIVASEEDSPSSHTPVESDRRLASSPTPSVIKTAPVEKQISEGLAGLAKGPSITDQFKSAQERAENTTLINQLAKSANQIASGIPVVTGGPSGMIKPTQVNNEVLDTNIALAQKIPDEFKAQLEMQHKDPTSQDSIAARDFLRKTLNIKVPDNISAAQLKEQFPVIEKMLAARENAQSRALQAEQNRILKEAIANKSDIAKGERLNETTMRSLENDKQVQALTTRQNAIKRGKDMLASGVPLSPQLFKDIMREIATGMTGTSAVAQSFVKDTDIKTIGTELAKYEQFLTGDIQDLRKVNPQVIAHVSQVLDQMGKGFEHDKQERFKELAGRRMQGATTDQHKKALQSYMEGGVQPGSQPSSGANEERRTTKDGRVAIFDRNTKQFIRYE